ncbi:MAG: ABC transporter ATP-binding protein [Bacilli bacterium]|nr:ABC transporter ATP-binding protein [Bacilli bacterium]
MSKNSILEEKEFSFETLDKRIWSRLIKIMWEDKRLVIQLFIFMILTAILDIIYPLLNRHAIDYYAIEQNSMDTLPMFFIVYVLCSAIQCLNVYLFFKYAARLESNFGKNLRQKAFNKLQNLSFSYFDKTANGWLMARLTGDVNRLAEILAWSIVDFVWGVVVMFGIAVVMLMIDIKMALCLLIIVPFVFMISNYFQKKILKAHRKTRAINSKITASFAEGINGAKTTKTLSLEQVNLEDFISKSSNMKMESIRAARINAMFQPVVFLFSAVVIASLLYIGGNQVLLKTIEFGTLVLFINYANLFFDPLKQIARILAEFQMAQANAERILDLLDEEVEITDREDVIAKYGTLQKPKTDNYEKIRGAVSFKNVTFYYNEKEVVLDNFNLDVKQGEMIALVGHTGSGKSTIVNMLCRFYEPVKGTIEIDGTDYRNRSISWLHSQLGYVLQTPTLFSGTIRENIKYAKPEATDEEMIRIAKMVNAHEFIMQMEGGYDATIGEDGDKLSTGEKQLISFARALLCNPGIVILDEATSSIDTEKEKLIQSAISTLLKGRTSFVVAHRLSTIVDADKIVVLDHGKIVELGTHNELMALKGQYYGLYTNQYREDKQKAIANVK